MTPQAARLIRLLEDTALEPGTDECLEIAGLLDQPLKPNSLASKLAGAFKGIADHLPYEDAEAKAREAEDADLARTEREEEREVVLGKLMDHLNTLKWMAEEFAEGLVDDVRDSLPDL